MDAISVFLDEMRRSDWLDNMPFEQRKYNDVGVLESEQSYQNKISSMYSAAVVALVNVSTEKYEILQKLVNEVLTCQESFCIPSDEVLNALMHDYNKSNRQIRSLKEDYDYLCFVRDCMLIQKEYLQNFQNKIPLANNQKMETTEASTIKQKDSSKASTKEDNQSEVIKGVKGLADYLHCGSTKAQNILNEGTLQNNGVAYRTGNRWIFNREKLDELLSNKPDILYKRNK